MPEAIATKKFMKSIYGQHPYGLPSSGTIDSINGIKTVSLKNFYKESKKVDNKKMKEFFSYKLKFPSYIEGLNYIRNNFI